EPLQGRAVPLAEHPGRLRVTPPQPLDQPGISVVSHGDPPRSGVPTVSDQATRPTVPPAVRGCQDFQELHGGPRACRKHGRRPPPPPAPPPRPGPRPPGGPRHARPTPHGPPAPGGPPIPPPRPPRAVGLAVLVALFACPARADPPGRGTPPAREGELEKQLED